jgi:isoleucyl-tRNA synthetase
MYPILSFTSEEIWQQLQGVSATNDVDGAASGRAAPSRSKTIFTETYLDCLFPLDAVADINTDDWNTLIEVRDCASKALEALRNAGDIGAALEAGVTIYAEPAILSSLEKLGDELRFAFITSTAEVRPLSDIPDGTEILTINAGKIAIFATTADGEKCVRCWHRREDVGTDTHHPELCSRCAINVSGDGEQRRIA